MNYNIKHKKASFIVSLIVFIITLVIPFCFFLQLTVDSDGAIQFGELMNVIKEFFKNLDFKVFDTYLIFVLYFLPLVGSVIGLFGKLGRTPNIINMVFNIASLVGLTVLIGVYMKADNPLLPPFIAISTFKPFVINCKFFDFSNAFVALQSSEFILVICSTLLTFVNMIKSK